MFFVRICLSAMSEEILKKTNASLIYRLLFKGGQQVVGLGLAIILARILSPAEFGVIAIANMMIHYANNFTNFGLNNALVQKDNVGNEHVNTVFTIDFAISLFLVLVTLLSAEKFAIFFHNAAVGSVLKWMSLYYVITTFYHIPVVILRRNIDFRFLTVVEFVEGLLTSVLAIVLALAGYSYWAVVVASLVMPALVTVVLMIKTHWLPKIVLSNNMGELYSFGFWNFMRAQVNLLISKVDYFVIGRYLDIESIGLYGKSFELTDRAMSGITMPINTIFFSTFSRLKQDAQQVKQVFLESSGLLALVGYPCLFGLLGVAPHFVMSCLGDQWKLAIVPLQILAVACLFRVLLGLVASVNVAIGKYKVHTMLNVVSAVFFVVLCFWVVEHGITAVSYAYLAYCFVSFCFSFWLLATSVHVRPGELLKAVWCPLVGSLLMLSTVLFLRFFILTNHSSLMQLLLLVSSGGSIYLVWGYFFYRKGIVSFKIRGVGKNSL